MKLYGELVEELDNVEDGEVIALGMHRGWEFEILSSGDTNEKEYGDFEVTLHVPKDQYPMLHRRIVSVKKREYLKGGICEITNEDHIDNIEDGEIYMNWKINLKELTADDLLDWVRDDIDFLVDFWEEEDD